MRFHSIIICFHHPFYFYCIFHKLLELEKYRKHKKITIKEYHQSQKYSKFFSFFGLVNPPPKRYDKLAFYSGKC